jgi:hypothetical protein
MRRFTSGVLFVLWAGAAAAQPAAPMLTLQQAVEERRTRGGDQ